MGKPIGEMDRALFHRRLRDAYRASGLTQRDLGDLIGTSGPCVSSYLTGKRTPNSKSLYKLCRALGVSADWLLGLKKKGTVMNEETKQSQNVWQEGGARSYRLADDCPIVAQVTELEDGEFELSIIDGESADELFAQRFETKAEAIGYGDTILSRKGLRADEVAYIDSSLSEATGCPNLSDECYLASVTLVPSTRRSLIVRAMPISSGTAGLEVAVTTAIASVDGIEGETPEEKDALEHATDSAIFISGIWAVYAGPTAAVMAIKGLIDSMRRVYPNMP